MALDDRTIKELESLVNQTLEKCERQWANTLGRDEVFKSLLLEFAARTNIPGHPFLGDNHYTSDLFVAFMLDMRDSTRHLRQAVSAKTSTVSQMQRVFYEVSALLTTMAKIIEDHGGSVTEYLGDGLLALYRLPEEKGEERDGVLRRAISAARCCMEALEIIVNPVLAKRYGLPPLQIGIGLAASSALISHFGLAPRTQVKVIGECVYFASQCSKGRNEITVHRDLKLIWPSSKGGLLRFHERHIGDLVGYVVQTGS